ncbi:MAG: DUF393 domain-containing protein [Deltaproteobacteria bacterium]|nr:DUF393 domain-containing protein [Deltaproteobacteria bacterium]
MNGKHWVLWDGACAFCRRAALWVKRKDLEHRFEIVAYQEAPSPPMTPALYSACQEALHVVTMEGKVLRSGRACLFILEGLGWRSLARFLRWPPLVWIVELCYRLVAANRWLFSRIVFRRD